MAKAPKCRICGVAEWGHICGPGVLDETKLETKIPKTETKSMGETKITFTPSQPLEPKIIQVEVARKRGRPRKYENAAERLRAWRARQVERVMDE